MASQKHICIIGNGISGITAARNIRKLSDYKITVISSESKHFYSRTALMYVYMGHMKLEHTKPYEDWFWTKNHIELVHDFVEKIDFEKNEIKLKTSQPIVYDELILATGSQPNKYGWPGQDLEGVSGLYSSDGTRKSIGAENTFDTDLFTLAEMQNGLEPIANEVWRRLERSNIYGRTVTLKVKFNNFETITRSKSAFQAIKEQDFFVKIVDELLEKEFPFENGVRLLGLTFSNLEINELQEGKQLTLNF